MIPAKCIYHIDIIESSLVYFIEHAIRLEKIYIDDTSNVTILHIPPVSNTTKNVFI